MAADRSYRIRGTLKPTGAPATAEIGITHARRLLPGSLRDGNVGEIEAASSEVVRVELENGFALWTRTDDLLRERGVKVLGRDGSEGWEIDLRPPSIPGKKTGDRGGERGVLGLGIKLVEFFGVDLHGKAALALGKTLELKRLDGNVPGLYRCSLEDTFSLSFLPATETLPAGAGPTLILLHGTASSCQGSFGKLWQGTAGASARARLKECYGDRVYSWEHRSLSESPIDNALQLVKRLPAGAELHLLSHSRGGLVGELLCLGERDKSRDPLLSGLLNDLFAADRTLALQIGLSPLSPQDDQERDAAYAADRERLQALLTLLDQKQCTIRRFIRVACPARGTTLASGRLDRWLSVLSHLTGNSLVNDVADFLLAVVKERTDPRTLPGLEAMMPGSALTRLLQHPALITNADLTVIAGDIEGDSLWGQIKLLATDWFYGADHDLVVNTGSMYGGLRRADKGARFLRDQGADVSHFNYFTNDRSVRWLVAGLTRADGSDAGFQPIQSAKHEEPRWRQAVRRSRAGSTPRPLAVVLPGTMGSVLKVRGDEVWLNYCALLWGGLKRLHIGETEVEPVDLVGTYYGPLLEFLARSHRVETFPYDWRLSVRDAAASLAGKLEDWLPEAERSGQPVHLIAHSMGGLVVRAMIADGGRGTALWQRIVALPRSRLMMLGTPNLGSYEGVRWLTGNNPTQTRLSLLDVTASSDEIVNLVRHYPGLVELLPFDADSPDFSRQALWNDLKQALLARWNPAEEAVLNQAQATWTLLRQAAPDPEHMIYVAGCQRITVAGYQLSSYEEPHLAGRKRMEFTGVHQGDGTVTWKSGLLPGVPVWYVEDTAHDELCTQKRALPGYLDLLMTGTTSLLPATPPLGARAAANHGEEMFVMPELPPTDDIPDETSVASLGFGPGRSPADDADRPAVPVIQISIRHGDLAYSRYPVLVGHYQGDTVINAEAALDKRLGGALSRRLQLGLYPGQPRTHALFFNEKTDGKPGGAVVVGLGQVGELSPGLLEVSVRNALLDFALQVAQWPGERFGSASKVRSAAISCLLVGSGPGGMAVHDCVEAILRGAVAANDRLERTDLNGRVLIDRIEFLELFEDVALAAAEVLENILVDGPLADAVAWPGRVIEEGQGRRRRVRYDDAPGWWHRMEIIEEPGRGLRFIASTDRARAEVTQATGQLKLADSFIHQASQSPGSNPEVARTLFEMLLPNTLKELAPRQTDLVLLLDPISARYPWELLEDRWSQNERPPAVQAGLVRQLKSPVFRPSPAHASSHTAYVVGNPDLDGWASFPDLPGARQEAQQVAALLRNGGYQVRDCIDDKTDAILDGLHKDAWRILHLAGHGEHQMVLEEDGEQPPVESQPRAIKTFSGMVIGKNTFLTPGDVEQMRWVPELVFINCCHLGKTQLSGNGNYTLLAANLGVQFINMGVKAVVAAGWAVDDGAANAFAATFYGHLLDGALFGEAVRAAREEIWARFPGVNTWGAYQCYGDPGFRLHGDGAAPVRRAAKRYHAPSELIADLDNYAEWVRVQSRDNGEEADLESMRSDIGNLFAAIPEGQREAWLGRGDVAAAAGFAWGETGAWGDALDWLEKAIHAAEGDCPVRAFEQCANFRVRLAGQRWQQMRAAADISVVEVERKGLIEEIQRAIRELDLVSQRAPTPERLRVLGSACKRVAWIEVDTTPRREALIRMADYYRQAHELDLKNAQAMNGYPDPYDFTNWATARLLCDLFDSVPDNAWRKTLEDDCRQMIRIARKRNERQPGFWDGVAEADCELVLLLGQSGLAAEAANVAAAHIAELYRNAAQRGASPREYASLLEHQDFVIALTGSTTDSSVLTNALLALRAAL